MEVTQFTRFLRIEPVSKILFSISVLSFIIFLMLSILHTLNQSFWFLLGAVPFLMSVLVCYAGFIKKYDAYFLDYISCVVSLVFAVFYLGMYWDSNYSAHLDALSDIGWITIVPVHFFVYFASFPIGLLACCLYRKLFRRRNFYVR